jgi:hypothetical protein
VHLKTDGFVDLLVAKSDLVETVEEKLFGGGLKRKSERGS